MAPIPPFLSVQDSSMGDLVRRSVALLISASSKSTVLDKCNLSDKDKYEDEHKHKEIESYKIVI